MIGKVLKYMRKEKKLKQSDLIQILNIGQSTLSDYENEKISVDFNTIEKIADICGFDIYFRNRESNQEFQVTDLDRKDL